ncbi:MAG: ABC transporter substrate-binding protein [Planctomycetota bacterium]
MDLDLERLATLAPTHVLATTGQVGLPTRVVEMAERRRIVLADLVYPNDLEEALGLIEAVGAALGRANRGAALAGRVRAELDGIAALTSAAAAEEGEGLPGVLMVFSTSPVMASGSGTVNDAVLRIAGGENAAGSSGGGVGVSAPIFDREGLRAAAPDVLVLMMPGAEPLSGVDDARLDVFRGLGLPAMEEERVVLLNDPGVLLPGPSVSVTAASLAVALRPGLAEGVGGVFREAR